jgi:hypothetical protein
VGDKYLDALESHLKDAPQSPRGSEKPPGKTGKIASGEERGSEGPQNPTGKTGKITSGYERISGRPKNPTGKTGKNTAAEEMGLVAAWSGEFGYIALHDPTTGEWHDLRTEDAPPWAKSEAFKRKDLYKAGNRRAFRLTAREMEEIWEQEHSAPEDEGIVEDHPIDD